MKIAVGGSRDFCGYEILKDALNDVIQQLDGREIILLSGHCRGTDQLVERYAEEMAIPIDLHPAQWEKYGKAAGIKRNYEMVDLADRIIAFWNGKSKGTKSLIDYARKTGKPVNVIEI